MTIGDVIARQESVAAESFLTIRPGSGVAWVLHTFLMGANGGELYLTDGISDIRINTFSGSRYATDLIFRASHNVWLKLKNTDSVSRNLGYTGVKAGLDGTSVGDDVLVLQQVPQYEVLDIRPGSGRGLLVTNIYFGSNYTLSFKNSTLETEIAADDINLPGSIPSLLDLTFEANNSNYFRLTNIDGIEASQPFGYSGVWIQ